VVRGRGPRRRLRQAPRVRGLHLCCRQHKPLQYPLHAPECSHRARGARRQRWPRGARAGPLGCLALARSRMRRLGRHWAPSGPVREDVLRRILAAAPPEVPANAECPICLEESGEGRRRWRSLPCGHAFHERCLLRWLRQARRCPLCRLDLHAAADPRAGPPAEASAHAAVAAAASRDCTTAASAFASQTVGGMVTSLPPSSL